MAGGQASEPGSSPSSWRPSGIVTLLTDFGLTDAYVGVMKGVLKRHFAEVEAIDLTHGVPAQEVRIASWHLAHAWSYFPNGTVHLAVVDPGVGTERSILLALDRGHAFLAPDNGLLGPILGEGVEVRALATERFALPGAGRTFHGRDVFAPAAAALAGGLSPAAAGELAGDWRRAEFPGVEEGADGSLVTEVLFADRFGNLITNLSAERLAGGGRPAGGWVVEIHGRELPLVGTYAEVAPGAGLALIGSCGTLEISVREGDAAARLGAGAGTRVRLWREE